MAAAVNAVSRGLRQGELVGSDVDTRLIGRCLHTSDCPPVDLMVRTSGETRLSDFMLWQVQPRTRLPHLRLDVGRAMVHYVLQPGQIRLGGSEAVAANLLLLSRAGTPSWSSRPSCGRSFPSMTS